MNKLTHPATVFLQALAPPDEVAFASMTPEQQTAIFDYMHAQGEGYWGDYASIADALPHVGDVRFGVGRIPNDDKFKAAVVACLPNYEESDPIDPISWFEVLRDCEDKNLKPIPVVMGSHPELAGEFGVFDEGWDVFYGYWAMQPEVEYVCCLPGWNPDADDIGRGGQ